MFPPSWIVSLQQRVLEFGTHALDLNRLVEAVAAAMASRGLAPARVSLSVMTEHPALSGLGYAWTRKTGLVTSFERAWGFLETEEHRNSPVELVRVTRKALDLDCAHIGREKRFPIIEEFVAAGATSYLAIPLPAARGDTHVIATWTDRPGGWTAQETAEITGIAPITSLYVELTENRRLLGIIGTAHEVTQRALAEQALRIARTDAEMREKSVEVAALKLEAEMSGRLELTEMELQASRERLAVTAENARIAREHLFQAQKMEAIGRLTGGLAHDFSNMLGVIMGNLDVLVETIPPDAPWRTRVDAALGAALRGKHLTRSLLALASRQTLTPERVDLSTHVRELLPLVRTTVGSGVQVIDELGELPVPINVDIGGLESAVLNLAANARDAMAGRGKLVLRACVRDQADTTHSPSGSERYAELSVGDNGPGMSPEVRNRAFEPFFTTKDAAHGTGLGLAMVHGFCGQSNGSARIDSEPGQGTRIILQLPLLDTGTSPTS